MIHEVSILIETEEGADRLVDLLRRLVKEEGIPAYSYEIKRLVALRGASLKL